MCIKYVQIIYPPPDRSAGTPSTRRAREKNLQNPTHRPSYRYIYIYIPYMYILYIRRSVSLFLSHKDNSAASPFFSTSKWNFPFVNVILYYILDFYYFFILFLFHRQDQTSSMLYKEYKVYTLHQQYKAADEFLLFVSRYNVYPMCSSIVFFYFFLSSVAEQIEWKL